jgi:hypothetical protein
MLMPLKVLGVSKVCAYPQGHPCVRFFLFGQSKTPCTAAIVTGATVRPALHTPTKFSDINFPKKTPAKPKVQARVTLAQAFGGFAL